MQSKVLMSRRANKWRNTADAKTVGLFEKRMAKLVAGDRSHSLHKRLFVSGKSKRVIFEAYVQQCQGGHRAIYSERRMHHDEVKAAVRLISK